MTLRGTRYILLLICWFYMQTYRSIHSEADKIDNFYRRQIHKLDKKFALTEITT